MWAQVLEVLRDIPDGAPVKLRISRGSRPEGVTLTEVSDAGRPFHLSLQPAPGAGAADEDGAGEKNGNGAAAGGAAATGTGAHHSANGTYCKHIMCEQFAFL